MSQLQNSLTLQTIKIEHECALELPSLQDVQQFIQRYEALIESEPEYYPNYLYLGLLYLLQEQEEAAQTTWLYLLSQNDEFENQALTSQLTELLGSAAKHYCQIGELGKGYLIRSHLQSIAPTCVDNILEIILIAAELGINIDYQIEEFNLISLLKTQPEDVSSDGLLQVLKKCISQKVENLVVFVDACLPYATPKPTWVDVLLDAGCELTIALPEVAIQLCEACLKLLPEDPAIWFSYAYFCSNQSDPQRSIAAAYAFKEHCKTSYWQVRGCYAVVRELTEAGYSRQAGEAIQELQAALLANMKEDVKLTDRQIRNFSSLIVIPGILQYFQDHPQKTRDLQNQVARKFQAALDHQFAQNTLVKRDNRKQVSKRLKIGYIGHTLRSHSVGWLCRWLHQYHNHDQFHITVYCVDQPQEEFFTQVWFMAPADASFLLPNSVDVVTQKIREDEIDILIDLDSMTFQSTCVIMAARSAPVQATWLGFDACGLPAIDYFIADPLVLPDNAQEYYQEKIWRLPQTYIAVDGFEVGVPDISRDSLNIPTEAVVYYTSQAGSKRNPANIRLQMQILKAVPNSFLLVKGKGEQGVIREMFTNLANEVGISLDQIRFLQNAPTEFVHRANMRIADVVLDTYPYTGATTTLEALWMGMPVVTKVGQQFAARNSYAFMTNVGVTEGIAYSDEEYVDWGIRLGLERELRHQVMWTLHQSRKTSPLWDAKAFTRQMEAAYKQMWEVYCQS
jgi:predicted O-linked N-acetylglucosamine transferase (SPINDLY family)